ncbi:MAG: IS91 family transposase, partial [Halieaceae bacterium]|nr:IS91 family transposase [Halieaceae bacterium]
MGAGARGRARPKHEVAEVFRQFEAEYSQQYRYSSPRGSVARNILQCRTAALGGQVRGCQACGKVEIAYNSCKDRHCPKCGAYDKAQWLEAQKVWVLPI